MKIKALKGFKDILPPETSRWQRIESTARAVFARNGFHEIKVPILEKTGLFARSIGETTDIVEKEMYTFTDRNGDSITLRPEGTASVLRAFIEHALHTKQPVQKLYTIGPMFRHERPQKGRLRQFHQMSVEVLGADQPLIDAELMAMAWTVLTELGLAASLEINSLGCRECRPRFNAALLAFLEQCTDLCPDCKRRRGKNPLRVLDCKNESCQAQYTGAPSIQDHLCDGCREHFAATEGALAAIGIPYTVNPLMVRGLDYYTRTTFELITNDLGAQSAVGAGGRYDGLVKQLGGPDLPGIGFALGMERLALLMAEKEETKNSPRGLFIAALGSEAQQQAFVWAHALRRQGLTVMMDYADRSLKSQMKQAGRLAAHALIVGAEELEKHTAVLRDLATRDQRDIALPAAGAIDDWARTVSQKISRAETAA